MKKTFMRTLAIVLTFCFTFAFSVSAGTAEIIGNIISTNNIGDLVEYDYVNKTYRTIPASSIPDYASMTTTTYELERMATELASASVNLSNTNTNSTVAPLDIITPLLGFQNTPPTQAPYSGVVLILFWVDKNGNGVIDEERENGVITSSEWCRGTGFLVAPDVVVTAGHNVVVYETDVPQVRIYPFYNSDTLPLDNNSDFVYPERWICSDYTSALNDAKGNTDSDSVLDNDWCVMKLQEPITDAHYFECSYSTSSVKNKSVTVSGYPGCATSGCLLDKCGEPSHITYKNYSSSGTVNQLFTFLGNRIQYTNNTKKGQSGSPVYDSDYICYAIHTHGDSDGNGDGNRGTVINKTVYNTISYYIDYE